MGIRKKAPVIPAFHCNDLYITLKQVEPYLFIATVTGLLLNLM